MGTLPIQAKLNADVKAKADLTSLANAGANLIDSPRKGIGKVLNTWMGRWFAKTDRDIALLNAQTIRDCQLIAEGKMEYREGKLLPVPDLSSVQDVYTVLHALNHQADAKRLGAAITEVARQLSGVPDEQIADAPLSQTFFNHWRREAEMIDEEDQRRFWAGLLVEETKRPDSISPKTLDVVKDLSRQDCEVFMRLCKGVVKNELLVTYDNKPVFGVYEDVVRLQDAGLVSHLQSSVTLQPEHGESRITISFANSQLGISVATADFCIDTFSLTKAGNELLRVLGRPVLSEEDVRAIKQHIDKVSFQETRFVATAQNADHWNWVRGHRPARFE